jgi:1,4-dihydroxy-2-naphthoate octaprenyltransferase
MKNYITDIFDRDTILHLRIPFSLFLFPIFCFAISQASALHWMNILVVFISLHFFIYPGSNVYNSYMDNDTGSIGGLKNPPPATVKLYYASIIMDTTGLILCLLVNVRLALTMLVFVAVSKAYSWRGIRIKKYGVLSWLVIVVFQGGFTFMLVNMSAENAFNMQWFSQKNIVCMSIASLLIGGFYPLTQIYQHEEDSERGDFTISYRLGIIGTFIFTAVLFIAANGIAFYYFNDFYGIRHFFLFNLCLLPVTAYFLYWFIVTLKDRSKADYDHSARMTVISSLSMIVCFVVIFFLNHNF